MRLGLIGLGRFGEAYARMIAGMQGVELVHTAARPTSKAPPWAERTFDPNWHNMLDPVVGLDGVIVATPPPTHAEIVRTALSAKIPVMVEKPFTQDVAEAANLADYAEAFGGRVLVDHTFLFHHGHARLKMLRAAGELPPKILIENGGNGPVRPETRALWDYGSHSVAMALDLFQKWPDEIETNYLHKDVEGETIRVVLRFGMAEVTLVFGNLFGERRFTVSTGDPSLDYNGLSVPLLGIAIRAFVNGANNIQLGVDTVRLLSICEEQLGG